MTNLPIATDHTALDRALMQMDAGLQFGKLLIESETIPDRWKKPSQVFSVVLRGQDFEFSPIQSLEVFYVVHGKIAMDSHGIGALVRKHGGDIVVLEESEKAVRVKVTRPGKEDSIVCVTIEDAEKAGWASKNPSYRSQPKNMLYAKALTFAARRLYQDVLKGMRTKEELEDMTPEEAGVTVVSPADRLNALVAKSDTKALPDVEVVKEKPVEPTEAPRKKSLFERITGLMAALQAEFGVARSDVVFWAEKNAGGRLPEMFTPEDFKGLYRVYEDLKGGVDPESIFGVQG